MRLTILSARFANPDHSAAIVATEEFGNVACSGIDNSHVWRQLREFTGDIAPYVPHREEPTVVLQEGAVIPAPQITIPEIDISEHLAMIDRAGATAIDAIRGAAELAAAGLSAAGASAPMDAAAPPPPSDPHIPPAPVVPAEPGWIKNITSRVDEEEFADEVGTPPSSPMPQEPLPTPAPTDAQAPGAAPPGALQSAPMPVPAPSPRLMVSEQKIIIDSEWGKAEIRYQVALQAYNGSTTAKALMLGPAGRRSISVDELVKRILFERDEAVQRVMDEY